MRRFLIKRLILLVPTLLGISVLAFLMVHLVPGDPAQVMLGERANAESLAQLREELGLDRPLHVQFGLFFYELTRGNLGRSIRTHERITTELMERFPATFELTMASMLIAIVFGTAAGLFAAVRRGKLADTACMIGATAGISMPVFWLGLLLILAFSVEVPIFPISGRLSTHLSLEPTTHFYTIDAIITGDWTAFGDILWHLALPAVTLSTIPMAVIARMTRASLLEVLEQDYIRTAWAKGLNRRAVILRHGLKNAAIPTLTVIALEFGYLLGGAVLTETIFAWPGVGRWIYLAVQARDIPAVQGGVLLSATVFVLVNLLADIAYSSLDPRIRYENARA